MQVPLREHQKLTHEYAQNHSHFLDASEPGTGKTLATLAQIDSFGLKTLVICPAYLARTWTNEAAKWFPTMNIASYIKNSNDSPHVLVIGYEMFVRNPEAARGREMLVCDEAHYCANPQTARTKAVFQLARRVKRLVLLTGTPMKNRPSDLYCLIKMVQTDTAFTEKFRTYSMFQNYFMNSKVERFGGRLVQTYYGMRNGGELSKWLKKNYIRHTLASLGDVPDMQHIIIEVDELSKQIDAELKAQFDRYEGNKEVVGDHISTVKRANSLLKANATIEFAESIMSKDNPVLVFTDHVETCEMLAKELKAPFIHGGVSHSQRARIVNEFQGGGHTAVVLTLGAASLGITLHRANTCIFNDLSWVPATNQQAAARVQRLGQQRKCLAYYMSRRGIDAYITGKLTEKSGEITAVIDDDYEARVREYIDAGV